MVVDEGDLITSGACNSYIDLSLYLIERLCGTETALECAKTILYDRSRSSQTPYAVHRFRKEHDDPQILAVRQRLEEDCGAPFDIEDLVRDCAMSRRSFERRFKAATGEAPLLYLQRLRVEKAKRLLETAPCSFNEIAYRVGYEDSSFFRKVFKKRTDLLPRKYLQKFGGLRSRLPRGQRPVNRGVSATMEVTTAAGAPSVRSASCQRRKPPEMARYHLPFTILPQPDDTTCGPTCLHAVYRYFNDELPLEEVIAGVPMLEGGGTLAVLLACHALQRGYRATIYTYKMQLFDPTWLLPGGPDIRERLQAQMRYKDDPRLQAATSGYLQFLDLGGKLRLEDLTIDLIRRYVKQGLPVITGLSATYLYRTPREYGPRCDYDDVRGEPSGHFVVLCGYNRENRTIAVADPLLPNPAASGQFYDAAIERVLCAILLGVLTYDANLLIIQPRGERNSHGPANAHRRR